MLFVERVILLVERILQVLDTTVWVQLLPWTCALATLAALERKQQAIEAGRERGNGPGIDSAIGTVDVGELVGIVLLELVCKSVGHEGRKLTIMSYSSCSFVHQTAYARS